MIAGERGFVIQSEMPVELLDFVVDGSGAIVDFIECRGQAGTPPCSRLSDIELVNNECAPANGCPTLRSASGELTAYLRATNRMHLPQETLVYEIVTTTRVVQAINEPTGRIAFSPGSAYFLAIYNTQPAPGTVQVLTISYDDGSTDEVRMVFNAPIEPASPLQTE